MTADGSTTVPPFVLHLPTDDDDPPLIVLSAPLDGPLSAEGAARRLTVASTGICPCGARLALPNRAARRRSARTGVALHVRVEHEPDCPAVLP